MTVTYWEIGRKIVEFQQEGDRQAKYGSNLIEKLSLDLTKQFGRGFGHDNLELMRLFYLSYPISEISESVIRTLGSSKVFKKSDLLIQIFSADELVKVFALSWTHYVHLIRRCSDKKEREFYEAEALRGGWSVRKLIRQTSTQFYQRTLLSKNKASLLRKEGECLPKDQLTSEEATKDPYVLEFLNLKDEYSESDLEEALINKLEDFLLELGDDFAFIGRQRRLKIGDEWYRVDLLFFHRRLRCLVLVDLKLGKFTHADAGQMHVYLSYVKEHWMREGENPPVGLILCAQKDHSLAHYALDALPNKILAAEYKLALPDEERLIKELSVKQQFFCKIEKRGMKKLEVMC
jgi:predicted nuclease of restriction endonuclease-like (RecB) superfamily